MSNPTSTHHNPQLLRDGVPVDIVRAPAMLGECVVLADRLPEAGRRLVTMRAVELCTLWKLPLPRLRLLMERCPEIEHSIVSEFKEHVRKFAARARRAAGRSARKAAVEAAGRAASESGGGGGGATPSPSQAGGPPRPRVKADLDAAVEHGMSTVAEGLDAMLLRLEEAAGIVISGSTRGRRKSRGGGGGGTAGGEGGGGISGAPRAASFGGFAHRGEAEAEAAANAASRPATAGGGRFRRPDSESTLGGFGEEEEEEEAETEIEPEGGSSTTLEARGAALAAADTEAFGASSSAAATPAAAVAPTAAAAPVVERSLSASASVPGASTSTFGRRTLDRLRASLGSQRGGGVVGGGGGAAGGGGTTAKAEVTPAGSVASSAAARARRPPWNDLPSRSASLPLPSGGTAAVALSSVTARARTHRRQPSASDVATSRGAGLGPRIFFKSCPAAPRRVARGQGGADGAARGEPGGRVRAARRGGKGGEEEEEGGGREGEEWRWRRRWKWRRPLYLE